nr:hypothetical protein [Xanthomonas campestris pv. campestris]
KSMKWNHWAAFGLILVAAFLRFKEYTCLARRSALAREGPFSGMSLARKRAPTTAACLVG